MNYGVSRPCDMRVTPFERNRLLVEVNRKDDGDVVKKILDILTRHEVPHTAVIILDE